MLPHAGVLDPVYFIFPYSRPVTLFAMFDAVTSQFGFAIAFPVEVNVKLLFKEIHK